MINDRARVVSVDRVPETVSIHVVTLIPLLNNGTPIEDDFFRVVLPGAFFGAELPKVGEEYSIGVWNYKLRPEGTAP